MFTSRKIYHTPIVYCAINLSALLSALLSDLLSASLSLSFLSLSISFAHPA